MTRLKLFLIISASAHFLVVGSFLIRAKIIGDRKTPSVYRADVVRVKNVAPPAEPADAQAKKKKEVKPEPPPKKKAVDPSKKEKERKKKEEEQKKRVEELLKERRRLEELRREREREKREEQQRKEKELERLENWSEELQDRKVVEETTVEADVIFPSWFIDRIHNRIYSVWEMPGVANGVQAKVAFTIFRDGSTAGVAVEKSSGNKVFDSSCAEAVHEASPFPELPALFKGDSIRVHVTFRQE